MVRVSPKALLWCGVAFLAVASGNGCATHDLHQNGALAPRGVRGLEMKAPVTAVRTLQPTFQWKGPKERGVSFDFIICDGVIERDGFWMPGKTAYYRGGLTTTEHTIERPLAPNKVYVWSVRSRCGTRLSPWAAYSDSRPKLFQVGKRHYNILCPFKTPGN